ncbi:MAG: rhodanese-like domain-containing protein [Candidatus Hodarchaeota archaeon]
MLTAAHAEDLSHLKSRVPRIDAHSAYIKYKSGKIIIADSMNPRTFAKYHILGAINLPTDSGMNRERWSKTKLPFPKNQEIIVYCD